ncbi:uncharacterized protein PHALS_15494 [Plasmopara halstedii]|uniref:Uncharacterized protein n=1 Tax=Plasmopara halstedii TaxID=4781 RepID=A0A0P1A5R6_PLAHL|nr:uncharacterized protein PHALS_15494 [Plasmopara halstedii]CEG35482.1 hypothetical protein PHALS_15494 [Plasmopara halstedii]|eukprot:XP_024571851.1 hypothetical protein PHALS_15494 [Plasmopara halstedii]
MTASNAIQTILCTAVFAYYRNRARWNTSVCLNKGNYTQFVRRGFGYDNDWSCIRLRVSVRGANLFETVGALFLDLF